MKSSKRRIFFVLAVIVVLGLCAPKTPSQKSDPDKAKSDNNSTASDDAAKRRESFELVWQTVNNTFYDANFNGVNWKAAHDRYAPLVARANNDEELYSLLQQMINEPHQSHFFIVPPRSIPKLSTDDAEDDKSDSEEGGKHEASAPTQLDRIRRRLAERLSTGIGIDLRVLDGAAVITRVEPGSPAARAGLRSGFVIKNVNGKPFSQTIAEIEQNPVFHQIIRPEVPMILVANYINGNLRDPVQLTYVDGRNLQRNVRITREKLNGEMSPAIGNLPPIFGQFAARRLPGRIGYIRFNAFVPALMTKVCAALREMHDEPAMIIDLRGNQGGLLGMIGGLAGLVEPAPVALGSMKMRTGYNSVFAFPQREPYTGELAILIDGSTLSAAEIFAAGMQETSRAVIVGEVSAGNTLPSGIIKLPTGALFQYAFGNYQTPSGIFLEGRGVIPDLIVKVSRRSLLVGGDPQLTAAIRKLRERLRRKLRDEPIADVTAADLATKKPTAKNRVEIAEPPPPPPPKSAAKENKSGSNEQPKDADPKLPSVEQIINRYIEAVGGEAALNKVTSRVSSGTIELGSMGLKGSVDVYEQAPNRSSVMMNLKGFGLVQQTFNGSSRWLHDPVQGYITLPQQIPGSTDELHRELGLKRDVALLRFEKKEKVGQRECFVLSRNAAGVIEQFYFDIETGLLLRQNSSYYSDYHEVDGVRVPFVVRQESPFGDVLLKLTHVKNNVPIDEAKFAERTDCFTKPEQYWHANKN
jgi:carboxyl-terminal processing protease